MFLERKNIQIIFFLILFLGSACRENQLADLVDQPTIDAPVNTAENPRFDTFTHSGQRFSAARTFGIDTADIDLDNDQDIVVTNYIGVSKLWINDGSGIFSDSGQRFGSSSSQAHDVGIADFNGDSYPDIFLIFHNDTSQIYFNDGSGNFGDNIQNLDQVGDNPQYIELGDIEQDGDVDIFIMYARSPNRLWINDGRGLFSRSGQEFGGQTSPKMMVRDLNGDQYPDLIFCYLDRGPDISFNDGSGNYTGEKQRLDSQSSCDELDGGDIDGDGDQDLVLVNMESNLKVWLNDDNSGAFIASASIFSPGTFRIKLIDADQDGDQDLITSNLNENENRLWLNEGSGNFTSTDQLVGNDWSNIIAADYLNGDERIDLILGNQNDQTGIEVYFNK